MCRRNVFKTMLWASKFALNLHKIAYGSVIIMKKLMLWASQTVFVSPQNLTIIRVWRAFNVEKNNIVTNS
jgi:hypothetical protein